MKLSTAIGAAALAFLPAVALAQQSGVPFKPIPPDTNQTRGLEAPDENRTLATVNSATAIHSDDLIGATVRNEQDETIGTVDGLLISTDAKIEGVVLDVGGFLGIGSRQVVVKMDQLSMIGDDLRLTNASRDSLRKLPPYQSKRR